MGASEIFPKTEARKSDACRVRLYAWPSLEAFAPVSSVLTDAGVSASGGEPNDATDVHCAVFLVRSGQCAPSDLRRQAFMASLTGVRHIVLGVDGLEPASEAQSAFDEMSRPLADVAEFLRLASFQAMPISSHAGDNLAHPSERFAFYTGPSLLAHLRNLATAEEAAPSPFRLLVEGHGAEGTELSGLRLGGAVGPGDEVVLAVTGAGARVEAILEADPQGATPGRTLRLRLDRPLTASRGDILASAADRPEVCDQFSAHLVWSGAEPLLPGRAYLLESAGRRTPVSVTRIKHKLDAEDAKPLAAKTLGSGEIGQVNLSLAEAIAFEPFERGTALGTFALIDPATETNVAKGRLDFALRRAANIHRQAVDVNKAARASAKNQRPVLLWFTGLSGAGKSTVANLVEKRLFALGHHTYLLDGDNVRHGLNRDLGFTAQDRVENIRRVAETAKLMVDAGLITLASFISPFQAERRLARDLMARGEFVEIFVDAPLAVAEERDPKGLYAQARAGRIPNFTGIDSPYEPPEAPEIHLRTDRQSAEELADEVVGHLRRNGFLSGAEEAGD